MFDSVIFAGGGCRCFWQLGFWTVVEPALQLRPNVATAVSAGSAMATVALLGRCEQTLRVFMAASSRNASNAYPINVLRGEPVFPHFTMYRNALLQELDASALQRLKSCPTDLRILLARPPRGLGSYPSVLLGLGCYAVAKRFGDPVHTTLASRAGFTAELVSVRSCTTPEQLADLILASSCTPPFTPALRRQGRPVLDGSLVDNAPLSGTSGRTLVLLTRRYGTMPAARSDRVYFGPSAPVPIGKWDYTNPRGLQRAFDLGRRDAEMFLALGT